MASILEQLPDAEVIVFGSELGIDVFARQTRVLASYAGTDVLLADVCRRHRVDAALVVLDPDVATAAATCCPVVYVDSLPFLWTRMSELPSGVSAHLAQLTPTLPGSCWDVLRRARRLRWIEGIVPLSEAAPVGAGSVVINLGGLASPVRPADGLAYPHVVLPPLLEQIAARGHGDVTITTSPAALACVERAVAGGPWNVSVRSLDHRAFGEALRSASLLATSPGLTTLLECGALRTASIVLPPQSVSQWLNMAAVVATGGGERCVAWPEVVLDAPDVDRLRLDGEAGAVEYIYGAIAGARGHAGVAAELGRSFSDALSAGPACPSAGLVDVVGTRGAVQVADIVRDVVA